MRRSNSSGNCTLPVLILSMMAGCLYCTVMAFKYYSIERRMEEKYDNAFNATTNSSLCEGGSLEHFTHHNHQDECLTYEPCHDYCVRFWDAWINFNGMVFMGGFAFVLGLCFLNAFIVAIEEGRIHFTYDAYLSLNNDSEDPIDPESLIEGYGGETTSLNSTGRFQKDQSQFYERRRLLPIFNRTGGEQENQSQENNALVI